MVEGKHEFLIERPQSPDLNPLDYSMWAHIESKACKVRHSNAEELKSSMDHALTSMRKDYIQKVCKAFRPRLEHVIAAKRGHIEKWQFLDPNKISK